MGPIPKHDDASMTLLSQVEETKILRHPEQRWHIWAFQSSSYILELQISGTFGNVGPKSQGRSSFRRNIVRPPCPTTSEDICLPRRSQKFAIILKTPAESNPRTMGRSSFRPNTALIPLSEATEDVRSKKDHRTRPAEMLYFFFFFFFFVVVVFVLIFFFFFFFYRSLTDVCKIT